MTRDPLEGVDGDGFVTTGVDAANISAPYDAIIDDVIVTARDELGRDLHGLYLYGSIATGHARPPHSDVDLVAVVLSKAAADRCARVGAALSARHGARVRTVWIEPVVLDDLFAEGRDAFANRCFLKHYCALLTGHDLRPSLARCAANADLARAFNATLASHLQEALRRLEAAHETADIANIAQTTSKRLLMAAAVALSTTRGQWSTDRSRGRELLAEDYPEHADRAELAHRWARMGEMHPGSGDSPAPSRRDIRTLFEDWGQWLVAELERRLAPR